MYIYDEETKLHYRVLDRDSKELCKEIISDDTKSMMYRSNVVADNKKLRAENSELDHEVTRLRVANMNMSGELRNIASALQLIKKTKEENK